MLPANKPYGFRPMNKAGTNIKVNANTWSGLGAMTQIERVDRYGRQYTHINTRTLS
jgi:hypothetical protein